MMKPSRLMVISALVLITVKLKFECGTDFHSDHWGQTDHTRFGFNVINFMWGVSEFNSRTLMNINIHTERHEH